MTQEVIAIENEGQWLAERVKDVTSTEVSALYGLSPYTTEFELFHQKRDGIVIRIPENDRMKWGKRLEAPIAHGVAEDMGWNIAKLDVYIREVEARIGSSFDFEIKSSSDGRGILEIKNVAELQYKRKWIDDGNGNIEAPEHIEMQIQHQMEVSGYEWCALVVLVGGNSPKVVYRQRDREIGADIRRTVDGFWKRVTDNTPPSADYTRDAAFIGQLYSQVRTGEIFDATGDAEIARLVQQYQAASAQLSEMEKLKDAYKAQLIERIGAAEKVVGAWGSINCARTNDSLGTLITPDMVGQTIGGRKGYRQFRINLKKEKAA